MKTFGFLFLLLLSLDTNAQFGRGCEWHETNMPDKAKVQYSRTWKITGIIMVGTGIYLVNTNQNPQRLDIPLIGFGTILTIEGIRLRGLVKKGKSWKK